MLPPWLYNLVPSALKVNACTSPFIFKDVIHSLERALIRWIYPNWPWKAIKFPSGERTKFYRVQRSYEDDLIFRNWNSKHIFFFYFVRSLLHLLVMGNDCISSVSQIVYLNIACHIGRNNDFFPICREASLVNGILLEGDWLNFGIRRTANLYLNKNC